MHPVLFTVPGALFKLLAPALILWGLYSLSVAIRRAISRPVASVPTGTVVATTSTAASAPRVSTPRTAKPKRAKHGRVRTIAEPDATTDATGGVTTDATVTSTSTVETTTATTDSPEAPPDTSLPLPSPTIHTPFNALIPIAIGIGLFIYASPMRVPAGDPIERGILALLGFSRAIRDPAVWSAQWDPLPVYAYGTMLCLSMLLGWWMTLRLAERQGFPRDLAADCFLVTAGSAVLGSRVLYVLTNLDEFRDPVTHAFVPAVIFSLRSGGLVAYGGFLGGLLGSVVFLRREQRSLLAWADAAVPSLASGLWITRVGCFLFGCDFGKPLSLTAPRWLRTLGTFPHWEDGRGSPAWLQHVALGFRADAATCREIYHGDPDATGTLCHLDRYASASAAVHPTQLYESLTGLVLLVVLVWLWRRRTFRGQIFLAFGALYGFARSALEIVRDDHERGFYFGLSTSQLIGLTTGALCVVLYLRLRRDGVRAEPIDLFERRSPQPV